VNGDTVHPAFLYESIWCFILFLILWRIDNKRKFMGQTFFLYCILYSMERFFVESLRTDSLMVHFPWGDFKQAQVLSVIVIIVAVLLYAFFYNKNRKIGFADLGGGGSETPYEEQSGETELGEGESEAPHEEQSGEADPGGGGNEATYENQGAERESKVRNE
jgi:hypothetical protein